MSFVVVAKFPCKPGQVEAMADLFKGGAVGYPRICGLRADRCGAERGVRDVFTSRILGSRGVV